MGCHFLLQGSFLTPGIQPSSLALADGFCTTEPPGKPRMCGQAQMCHTGVDLKGKARSRQGAISQRARQRAAGVGITFTGCLPSRPRVPEQLRTHFARSWSLLNVLWQHLVEQRKNCTAPWREMLLLLISSLPKALQRQRFMEGAGRGPIRGPASRLPARLYSSPFLLFSFLLYQAENTHCCIGKSSLAGTRK